MLEELFSWGSRVVPAGCVLYYTHLSSAQVAGGRATYSPRLSLTHTTSREDFSLALLLNFYGGVEHALTNPTAGQPEV